MADVKSNQSKVLDLIWTAVSMLTGLAFMHFANKLIVQQGYAAMAPPHAASLVISICVKNDPYKMGVGYLSSAAAAYAVREGLGDNFLPDFGGSRALMVAAAVVAMKLTESVHPPAAAYAMTLADAAPMKALGPKFIAYPGFLGACVVYVAALVANNVRSLLTTGKLKSD